MITGFVGLAVAIRPSLLSAQGVHGIRLRLHIAQTVTLMFLCLMPNLIIELQMDRTLDPWPAANGLMSLSFAGLMIWRIRAYLSIAGSNSPGPMIAGVVLHFPVIVLCGLNATGVLERYGSAIFYAGILVSLATACATFVLLLAAATESDSNDI